MIAFLIFVNLEQLGNQGAFRQGSLGWLVNEDTRAPKSPECHIIIPRKDREDAIVLIQVVVLFVHPQITVHIGSNDV
ncbi:hypothetical protein D3C76_1771700 [compost metagenome]